MSICDFSEGMEFIFMVFISQVAANQFLFNNHDVFNFFTFYLLGHFFGSTIAGKAADEYGNI